MKTTMDLRPVYHRREDRIRAHVLLCWLALLLIRIAETTTGHTWTKIRDDLERMHLGMFTGPAGTFCQRTELSQPRRRRSSPSSRSPSRHASSTRTRNP